jgi:hypothetical protein
MSIRTPHDNSLDALARSFPTVTSSRAPGPQLLSTLWIYVLLSMLFRDVHEFLRDGFIHELATAGTVNGSEVSGSTLLVSGLVLQLPLAMVVLSRILPRRISRVANTGVAAIMALGVVGVWPKDADDIVFGIFQLVGLAAIVIICHRWHHIDIDSNTSATNQPPQPATP